MTIPHFRQQQFIDFLISKGAEIVDDENWNKFNRIIVKYNNITFPLQMCKVYYYFTVCRICEEIGIEPPEEFKTVNEQIKKLRRDK